MFLIVFLVIALVIFIVILVSFSSRLESNCSGETGYLLNLFGVGEICSKHDKI